MYDYISSRMKASRGDNNSNRVLYGDLDTNWDSDSDTELYGDSDADRELDPL